MRTSSNCPFAELPVAPLGVAVLRLSPMKSDARLASRLPVVVPTATATCEPFTYRRSVVCPVPTATRHVAATWTQAPAAKACADVVATSAVPAESASAKRREPPAERIR